MNRSLKIKDAQGVEIDMGRIICGGSSKLMLDGAYDESYLRWLVDHHVNTFDLARVYGNGSSEEHFGRNLGNIRRSDIVIITKCCHPKYGIFRRVDRQSAIEDVQASLKAMGVDYVDLVLLHRDDERKDIGEIITFMNELIVRGYTRAIGVSNFSIKRIKEANDYAKSHSLQPFVVNEPQFSLVVRKRDPWHNGSKSMNGNEKETNVEFFSKNNISVLCYSSLADGFLSGKYRSNDNEFKKHLSFCSRYAYYDKRNIEILRRAERLSSSKHVSLPQLSLSYVLHQRCPTAAIVNLSSIQRAEENLGALDVDLTDDDIRYLENGNQ